MTKPLAVALATCVVGFLPAAQGALNVRELFDGLTPALHGAGDSSTSIGFEAGTTWAANITGSINVANNFNVNPGVTNQMAVQLTANGGIWWQPPASGQWGTGFWATRQLAAGAALNMNADGVYYITYNMRRRNDSALGFGFANGSAPTSQFISVGATWNNTSFNTAAARKLVVARGTLNVGQGPYGATAYSGTQVNNDDRNVVLIKITTSSAGNDTIQAAFYNVTRSGFGALPASEAGVTWDVTDTFTDANVYTHLLAYVNGPTSSTELDAFRMGTSYADVVQLAPIITSQPVPSPGTVVYSGGTLTMSVTASGGYPLPLSYQWFTEAGPVTDATNATLRIENFAVANAGSYYVVVTNVNGTVTSVTNTITTADQAAFVSTQPAGGTRYVGGRITLSASVSGSMPMQLQWTRDGEAVEGGTNSILVLTNIAAAQGGSYVLTATNAFGGTATEAAAVTVVTPASGSYEEFIMNNGPVAYWRYNDAGPAIAADVASGYDATNNAVTYGTGVTEPAFPGFPADNTAGVFDGVASASTTGVSLMNNRSSFTIIGWFNPDVMPQVGSGNGRVALFGQNDAAELGFHGTTSLGIWTPGGGFVAFDPTMLITPGNWYMLAGVGDGTNVTFYLNGNQVAKGGNATANYGSSTSPFRIGSAVLDTTGNFFDGSIDEVAVFDRALPLDVLNAIYAKAAGILAPTITAHPASLQLFEGGTARFRVDVTGTLPFTYYWEHDSTPVANGGNISGAGTPELTIANVTAADGGNYSVVVENMASFVFSDPATLTVVPRPTDSFASLVFSNNPSSWWQLNESAGSTVAYDYVGARNGTYGSASIAGVPGAVAPSLPAGNTALQTGPAGSAVQLPPLNLNSNVVTIAAWINPVAPAGNFRGIVFSRDAGTVSGLHFGDGNELRYSWNDASATWGWNSGLQAPSNQWSLAVLVITPTNGTIYLGSEGRLRSAVNVASNAVQGFAGATWIGQDPTSADRTFNGSIDEVAIFNRALSQAEVANLYLGAVEQPLTISITPSTAVVADSRTVGLPHDGLNLDATWLANDTDGGLTRSGVMSFASGTPQQVRLPASADFNSPTGVISFWMRSSGTAAATNGNDGAVLVDRRTGAGDVIVLLDDGSIFIQPEWMYNASSTKKVNDNLWHHIAYVYDQSATGYIKVYIDGVLDISRTNPREWSWPAGQQIELGLSHDSWWKAYDGKLDDFRVYNSVMTDAQVMQLMADTAGEPAGALMVRFNFDTAPHGVMLDWSAGSLETATEVNGPWQIVPGASAPWPVSLQAPMRYYKAVVR